MENAAQRLELKNLKKATKTALVMDEVSFTVHESEIFALVGAPASCKSLISKIIINLVKKTNGEVLVEGVTHRKIKASIKKIGVSLEQQKFYQNKTVYSTLEQYAILNRRPLSHRRIVNTLNLVDLKKSMHHTLDRLDASGIARLKIAAALFAQPEILVLDEPFKDLTQQEAHNIRIIIKTVADTKKSAVFLTARNITDVEEICDTIGIIDDGFIVSIKSYNQYILDDAPYETMRVMTQSPNYAAKIIEKNLNYQTHLCGEWVVVDALPASAQEIADELGNHDIKVLSVQRVNRSLQEQFYEIISSKRRNIFGGAV